VETFGGWVSAGPPTRDWRAHRVGFFLINRPRTPLQRGEKKSHTIETEEESAATTRSCLLRAAAFERPAFRWSDCE